MKFLRSSSRTSECIRVFRRLTTIELRMQGFSVKDASLVIAPQPQIPNTNINLANDDANYDERGVSACRSPSIPGRSPNCDFEG